MSSIVLPDKKEIEWYLLQNPQSNIYLIGDLDDFYWPKTDWYALKSHGKLTALILLYKGLEIPTLLAFCTDNLHTTRYLLFGIKSYLPLLFNAHLSFGLIDVFGENTVMKYYGHNDQMLLYKNPEYIKNPNIRQLKEKDLNSIYHLYEVSYPGNWFNKHMLLSGKYLGYFSRGKLIGIAGIHVYSEKYKVAALGNITTHPDFRGQRISYKLTSQLCHELRKTVHYIGLNVRSDNTPAITCYRNIGFKKIGGFNEYMIKLPRS